MWIWPKPLSWPPNDDWLQVGQVNRCAVCEVPANEVLCSGCQSLITSIEHPCQRCAKPLDSAQQLCGDCRQHPPAFSHTHCATIYQPPVSLWVHQLKFGGRLERAAVLAAAISPLLRDIPPTVPLIPVPLHSNRLRKRGYNQALEVARLVARDQRRSLITDVLVRHRATRMQAELTEQQRQHNVRGAFKVTQPLQTERVLLLDDVMTTGQTLHAASMSLLEAGVQRVEAVVFARSG